MAFASPALPTADEGFDIAIIDADQRQVDEEVIVSTALNPF